MTTQIPTQAQYAARERRMLHDTIQRCGAQSLAMRRAAKADFRAALLQPDLISTRTHWLFEGCYGWGACDRALAIREGRGNKAAALSQLLACLDWNCPQREAIAAWHSITPEQQAAASKAILGAMSEAPTAISKEDRA